MLKSGLPLVGLHLVMGPDAQIKITNMVKGIENGHVAPIEMIFKKTCKIKLTTRIYCIKY